VWVLVGATAARWVPVGAKVSLGVAGCPGAKTAKPESGSNFDQK